MSLQDEVGYWGEKTFPLSTPKSIFAHLRREIDELEEALAFGEQESIEEECADCQLILWHLAHRHGFQLTKAASVKFVDVQGRRWGQPDAEGVVEHIR